MSGDGAADAYAAWPSWVSRCRRWCRRWPRTCPAVQSGNHVYVSGQLPMVDGKLPPTGKVGAEVTPEQGAELARDCALNALAADRRAGRLGRIVKIVKVTGFVASAAGFTGQPGVINGASSCSAMCWVSWAGTPAARSAWPSCRWARRSRSRSSSRSR